jgi:hypothetical protein
MHTHIYMEPHYIREFLKYMMKDTPHDCCWLTLNEKMVATSRTKI